MLNQVDHFIVHACGLQENLDEMKVLYKFDYVQLLFNSRFAVKEDLLLYPSIFAEASAIDEGLKEVDPIQDYSVDSPESKDPVIPVLSKRLGHCAIIPCL
jgi:hypothetical protein